MKHWVNIDWDTINSQYTLWFVQTLKPPYFLKVNLPTDQATSPKIQKPVGQVLKILGGTVASKKAAIWSGFHVRRQTCLEFEKLRELYMVILWLYRYTVIPLDFWNRCMFILWKSQYSIPSGLLWLRLDSTLDWHQQCLFCWPFAEVAMRLAWRWSIRSGTIFRWNCFGGRGLVWFVLLFVDAG